MDESNKANETKVLASVVVDDVKETKAARGSADGMSLSHIVPSGVQQQRAAHVRWVSPVSAVGDTAIVL